MRSVVALLVCSSLVPACSGSDDAAGDEGERSSPTVAAEADPDDFTRTTDEMRPVPTVPPSTLAGQSPSDDSSDGVVEIAPTLVPDATSGGTGEQAAPPSTELVGDPQPAPGTTAGPPPSTIEPPPAACARLDAVAVRDEIVGFAAAVDRAVEIDDGCRYEAGPTVVEIRFVPLDEIRGDWFGRAGIEPVAEAGGDSVGLDGFRGADGSTGAGYTVAIAGGADGAIVSVSGSAAPRLIAAFVAVLAAEA